MKSFAQKINPLFAANANEILNLLQPVCGLISLYNGPSLLQAEWKENESGKRKNALAGGYAFVLQSKADEIIFEYFHLGEIQLKLNFKSTGDVKVEMIETISSLIEVDLRKKLLEKAVNTGTELTKSNNSNVRVSTSENKEFTEKKPKSFELKMLGSSVSHAVFLPAMNKILQDFTQGLSPQFEMSDVIHRTLQDSPESVSFFTKSLNDYCVDFSDRYWDSGSHSYPNGFEFQFSLSHEKAGKLVDITREGNQLRFTTSFDDKDRFALKVKLELEGKI